MALGLEVLWKRRSLKVLLGVVLFVGVPVLVARLLLVRWIQSQLPSEVSLATPMAPAAGMRGCDGCVLNLSSWPLSVADAFLLPQEPKLRRGTRVEELAPLFHPGNPAYWLRNKTTDALIYNHESKVHFQWQAMQFEGKGDLWMGPDKDRWHHYFGLLHAHTQDSDGLGSPDEAWQMARDKGGLDFMAVTDHPEYWLFQNVGAWETQGQALEAWKAPGYLPLRGFEYSNAALGHIVVLGSHAWRSSLEARTLEDFYRWLSSPGNEKAVAFFAHPGFHSYRAKWDFLKFKFFPKALEQMVGMEVIHANIWETYQGGFTGRFPYLDESILRGWRPGVMASQDNHFADWGVRDSARTVILSRSLDETSLLGALRARRFYATQVQNFYLTVDIQDGKGQWHPMGSRVQASELGGQPLVRAEWVSPNGEFAPELFEVESQGHVLSRVQEDELSFAVANQKIPWWKRAWDEIRNFDDEDESETPLEPMPAKAGRIEFRLPPRSKGHALPWFTLRIYHRHGLYSQSSPIYIEDDEGAQE